MIRFTDEEAFHQKEITQLVTFVWEIVEITNFEVVSGGFVELIFELVVMETVLLKFGNYDGLDTLCEELGRLKETCSCHSNVIVIGFNIHHFVQLKIAPTFEMYLDRIDGPIFPQNFKI